jgi:pyrimidine-nucleoside phosphorylase
MHIPTLIELKRDGHALSADEIRFFIDGFTDGTIADSQMAALAMAIYFKGMDAEETAALTRSMLESGSVFSWPEGTPPKVDKHSTGGIGDKVSLVLAPLLACDELWVPMVSGRGLGITGGTLDKLEAIPGFRTNLTFTESLAQLEKVGCFISGQTSDLCPADRKLYALRDVTGTVPSQPLIVASIMSKKLAESLDALVLDVKFGSGAFMKTRNEATSLAESLRAAGEAMGVRVSHRLTPMDEPLGRAVGNALEVTECIATLQGQGPRDLIDLTLDLACELSPATREQLSSRFEDGSAWTKFVAMVEAQGGDATALDRYESIHPAPVVRDFPAPESGILQHLDAGVLGHAALELGAGRAKTTDTVDFAVGFDRIRKTGERIEYGEPVLRIHARGEGEADEAARALRQGISIS